MTSKRLVDQLLKLNDTDDAKTSSELADAVLKRDRYRLRWMTELAILFWLLAVGGAIWIAWECWHTVHFMARSMQRDVIPEHTRIPLLVLTQLTVYAIGIGGVSLFLIITGCVSGIVLMFQLRSATMRQINFTLERISKDLEQTKASQGQSTGHSDDPHH